MKSFQHACMNLQHHMYNMHNKLSKFLMESTDLANVDFYQFNRGVRPSVAIDSSPHTLSSMSSFVVEGSVVLIEPRYVWIVAAAGTF